MERLQKIGMIQPRCSNQIKESRIGLGFEKLDRDVFDPEKAYDKVAALGVKWIRIQSGWQRTERERGVYQFEWLDQVIDNLTSRGLTPWICLCYGNVLYSEEAKTVFGAVGIPPIHTEEQKNAWSNYVKALVDRYQDRVTHYEIWNEPDGKWCWKHGPSGTELGHFSIDTAKAIRAVCPKATIIGGVVCKRGLSFLTDAFETGMGDWIDAISFHEYTPDERQVFERVKSLKALAHHYNPNISVIQGESGSQSRSDGAGALAGCAFTPRRQAKQLLRHTVADLLTDVVFTSYFSCMDMIEALNGTVGDISSYLDYGYFGVLGADFDEQGKASGEYTPKPSYYALQNLTALFSDSTSCDLPLIFQPEGSKRLHSSPWSPRYDESYLDVTCGGLENKKGGKAFLFWKPTELLTTEFESTITFECNLPGPPQLVDLMGGSIYSIPQNMTEQLGEKTIVYRHLPIKDYPMALLFGDWEVTTSSNGKEGTK